MLEGEVDYLSFVNVDQIFSGITEYNGPGPRFSEMTLKILVHLNILSRTKIFSTMFEKNGPGPIFSRKIAEIFVPWTKIPVTVIPRASIIGHGIRY